MIKFMIEINMMDSTEEFSMSEKSIHLYTDIIMLFL